MIKKNLKLLILTSLVILLPVLAGVILWNQLPEQIPIHWNAVGEVDGWSHKAFAIFGLPGFMLAAQWLCSLGTSADPKKEAHSEKMVQLVLWIIPLLCVVLMAITYATALGYEMPIERIMPVVLGFMFTVIGNYMPKCKQNYTIGIKIAWTLSSEENWNRTHRFAGWLWTACGIAIMLIGFFGGFWVVLAMSLVMVIIPILYSYLLYRRGI